jgi:hypothetical protein
VPGFFIACRLAQNLSLCNHFIPRSTWPLNHLKGNKMSFGEKLDAMLREFIAKIEHEFDTKSDNDAALHASVSAHADTLKAQLESAAPGAPGAPATTPVSVSTPVNPPTDPSSTTSLDQAQITEDDATTTDTTDTTSNK